MASTTTGCNEHKTESGQTDNCIMVPPFPSTSLPRRTAIVVRFLQNVWLFPPHYTTTRLHHADPPHKKHPAEFSLSMWPDCIPTICSPCLCLYYLFLHPSLAFKVPGKSDGTRSCVYDMLWVAGGICTYKCRCKRFPV